MKSDDDQKNNISTWTSTLHFLDLTHLWNVEFVTKCDITNTLPRRLCILTRCTHCSLKPAASVLHNKKIVLCCWPSSSFMSVTDQSKSHPALVRLCEVFGDEARSMMERSQFWPFLFGGGMESLRAWLLGQDHLVICQLHVIKYREGDVLWWLTEFRRVIHWYVVRTNCGVYQTIKHQGD